ncbi:MAG: type II toxin-antitoxin system HicA family toxin [Papillibacter sp.]|jgi:hypothetical protein|nr:type II toxin-antitoxin system HicA family toxin [Papillibacter sp.]
MGRKDEQIKRLLSKPKDYTISELDILMSNCGCIKDNRGKTSGSAIKYLHEKSGAKLFIHEPHPRRNLPEYAIKKAISFLTEIDEI